MNKKEFIELLDILKVDGIFEYPYDIATETREFNLWIDEILNKVNGQGEIGDWDE